VKGDIRIIGGMRPRVPQGVEHIAGKSLPPKVVARRRQFDHTFADAKK